jgi:hypothetical protein
MLTIIGIIPLLVWLFDYAVHLTVGSLVQLLLLFAAISFGLDFLRSRSSNGRERRPNWDHRPPKEHRRRFYARGSLASRSRSQSPKFLAT